jgi:hypothetical protein
MEINEAETKLLNLLEQSGIDYESSRDGNVDILKVWQAFKRFAEIPYAYHSDEEHFCTTYFCFVCGIYLSFNGKDMFHFHFWRTFDIYFPDEYVAEMYHVGCQFEFEPTDEVNRFKGCYWSFNNENGEFDDTGNFSAYFQRVENLPEFQIPLAMYQPVSFRVYQSET